MTNRRRNVCGFFGFALIAATLAGCSQQPIAIFDQPQGKSDVVESSLIKDADLDPDSVRYIGTDSRGVRIFAAKSVRQPPEICVLTIPIETEGWASGCTTQLPISSTSADGYIVTLDNLSAIPKIPDNATQIGDYVYVQKPAS